MKEKLIRLIEIIICLTIIFFLFYKPTTPKKTESTFNEDNPFQIQFIDQTTPNMIQRISKIFARNPLISSGL